MVSFSNRVVTKILKRRVGKTERIGESGGGNTVDGTKAKLVSCCCITQKKEQTNLWKVIGIMKGCWSDRDVRKGEKREGERRQSQRHTVCESKMQWDVII